MGKIRFYCWPLAPGQWTSSSLNPNVLCYKGNPAPKRWLGNSPDVNPSQNWWGLMNWEVSRKNPIAIPKIKKICKAILRRLTPNYVPKLLASMPRQMALCIEVDNGFIKYCCYIFKILCCIGPESNQYTSEINLK